MRNHRMIPRSSALDGKQTTHILCSGCMRAVGDAFALYDLNDPWKGDRKIIADTPELTIVVPALVADVMIDGDLWTVDDDLILQVAPVDTSSGSGASSITWHARIFNRRLGVLVAACHIRGLAVAQRRVRPEVAEVIRG